MPSQTELRQQITDRIIESLQSGQLSPWRKPWKSNGPHHNVVSHRSYSGVNPLLLEISSQRFGFTSSLWGTFKQWKELGGFVKRRPANVKPGQWGTSIVFTRAVTKTTTAQDGTEDESTFWMLKNYTVFNLDQVDGPFDHLRPQNDESTNLFERYEQGDALIEASGADIRTGSQAAYIPSCDFITLPPKESFDSAPDYYETAFHELTHWTEPPHRLNWNRKGEGYAMGELIAEMGACFLCNELGIPFAESLENHAAYVGNWAKKLHDAVQIDPSFIMKASTQASKVTDYLLSFSPTHAEESAMVM